MDVTDLQKVRALAGDIYPIQFICDNEYQFYDRQAGQLCVFDDTEKCIHVFRTNQDISELTDNVQYEYLLVPYEHIQYCRIVMNSNKMKEMFNSLTMTTQDHKNRFDKLLKI